MMLKLVSISNIRYGKKGNEINCVTVILECIYGTPSRFNTSFSRISDGCLRLVNEKNFPLPTHYTDRFGSCNTCTIELWEQQLRLNRTVCEQFSRLGLGFCFLHRPSATDAHFATENGKLKLNLPRTEPAEHSIILVSTRCHVLMRFGCNCVFWFYLLIVRRTIFCWEKLDLFCSDWNKKYAKSKYGCAAVNWPVSQCNAETIIITYFRFEFQLHPHFCVFLLNSQFIFIISICI